MKFQDFVIKGFGVYENIRVNSLSHGMNLFWGDNEAGKSTLLAFFRDILFGFESGRAENSNSYKPQGNASHGGRITLITDDDQKSYGIERSPGKAAGSVTVTMPDGTQQGEETLSILLPPGFTKNVYRNVYGFSLDELQDMNTLKSDDVRGRIYSSTAGAGQVDVMQIDRDMEARMEKLFKPRGSVSEINKKLSEMELTEDNIGRYSQQSAEYLKARSEIPQLQAGIRQLEEKIKTVDERLTLLGKIRGAWPKWEEMNKEQSKLEQIPQVESFPEKGVERYERCKEDIAKARQTLNRISLDIETKHKELSKLQVNMQLLAAKTRIEETLGGKSEYEGAKRDISQVKADEERVTNEIERLLRDCGNDWTEVKALDFDISVPVRNQINQLETAIKNSEKEWEALQNRLETRKSEYDNAEETLRLKERDVAESKSLKTDPGLLTEWENAIQQIRQSFHNIETLASKKEDRVKRVQELQDDLSRKKQATPTRGNMMILYIIITVFLFGLAAFFYHGSALMAIVLVALGLLILIVGYNSDRNAKKQRMNDNLELESLSSRIEDGRKDIADIESKILAEKCDTQQCSQKLRKPINSVQDADEAEKGLRVFHDRNAQIEADEKLYRELRGQFEITSKEYRLLQAQTADKERQLHSDQAKWMDWLRQKGFPETYSSDTIRDLFTKIELIREKRNQRNGFLDRIHKMDGTIMRFESKVKELLTACGGNIPENSQLVSALLQLREDLSVSADNNLKRENLEKDMGNRVNDGIIAEEELKRYQKEFEELLLAAEARDENEFRERYEWYSTRVNLENSIRDCREDIRLLAGEIGQNRLIQELSATDKTVIERESAELASELNIIKQERDSRNQDLGKNRQTIETLEKSDELSNEIAKRESLRAELNNLASKWAVLAICKRILKETRDRYEREKQPKVIKSASDMIRKMTNGAYKSVFAPLGEQKFELLTPADERKEIGTLSRGAREQLYLAIRFGLIKEYSGEPLPVIMDDILVNFDPQRVKAAAECILDLSHTHQVLFFTCHPQINDLFLEMNPDIARFRISGAQISRN